MERRGSVSSDNSSIYAPSFTGESVKANKTKIKAIANDKGQDKGGAAIYFRFEKQVGELDKELRKLCNKARKLGSSAGILSASTRLRDRLGRVLHVFRENAADLYPEEVKPWIASHPPTVKPVRQWKNKNFLDYAIQSQTELNKPDNLALEFRMFSQDVETLFECFVQFPQFVEEIPDWSLAKDLSVWAQSLNDFEHEFKTQAVEKYLYDSMADIGTRLETLAKRFIPTFTKIGIPTVRASQDHGSSNLQNQTIVSTLFAGITASMIQVWAGADIISTNNTLNTSVSVFWYMSLVFSISSAVNSLLGLSWVQAIYRSPDHRVPWWVLVWIKRCPLVFLVLAVACFFIALMLFVFASVQSQSTATVTTILSGLSCIGLIAMSAWFTCELIIYSRYEGKIWLDDAIGNAKRNAMAVVQKWGASFWRRGQSLINYRPARQDEEKADLTQVTIGFRRGAAHRQDSDVSFWLAHDKEALEISARAKHRWHEAVRRTIILERQKRGRYSGLVKFETSPQFAHLTSAALNCMRFGTIPKLQSMTISAQHNINERHRALVRSLQFSPEGKYLLTSSWDSTSFLFRVGRPVLCERELVYPTGFGYVHQVEWSPNGQRMLIRSNRRLMVWHIDADEADGNVKQVRKIMEHEPKPEDRVLRLASWHGDSDTIFSVQGGRVLTMNVKQEILRDYPTQYMTLRDICVSSNSMWMICVGQYIQEDQRLPQKYGILLWDLMNHKVVKKMPVFYEMNNISIACDNASVLVNYENKSPPQIWYLQISKTGADLTLRHTYMPQDKTSFAALPSIFGGELDHLILRAAAVGDIHVWDRESAAHIFCIKAPSILQSKLTSFTWNRGSREYMFATGTHDGTVHIWAIPADERPAKDARASSMFTDEISATPTSDDTRFSYFSPGRRTTTGQDEMTLVSPEFAAGQ